VAGAPDSLQPGGHGLGALELVDEVDRPDVDAQLQRGRRHERVQAAGLQVVLGLQARFLGHRAVVHAHPRGIVCEIPEAQRGALGLVAAVAEDERGVVAGDLRQQQLVGARPERAVARLEEVRQRGHHLHIEILAHAGVEDGAGARAPALISADQEGSDLFERAEGGRAPH
jgi:hypothetical protein